MSQKILNLKSVLVDSVLFGSELPWPTEPNGNGPTLELYHYSRDNSMAEFWKTSFENLGTPGKENSISTGVDWLANSNSDKQLKIYPNPFTTETRLKMENNGFELMHIQIYSMDGRMVHNVNTTESEYVWRGDNQVGQKLQPGIYICKVQSGNQIFTEKVIFSK